MKKIVVKIVNSSLSKSYTINLEDDFAKAFENELNNLMNGTKFIDAGKLLEAFIQKSYENFFDIKKIDSLISENGKEKI